MKVGSEMVKDLETSAWIRGFALALAEVHRITGADSAVCEVVRDAGLFISDFKKHGAASYDWKQLEKAGVPLTPKKKTAKR